MTYCATCGKLTNNYLEKEKWNTTKNMVYVHCEECKNFKTRYLEDKKNEDINRDR